MKSWRQRFLIRFLVRNRELEDTYHWLHSPNRRRCPSHRRQRGREVLYIAQVTRRVEQGCHALIYIVCYYEAELSHNNDIEWKHSSQDTLCRKFTLLQSFAWGPILWAVSPASVPLLSWSDGDSSSLWAVVPPFCKVFFSLFIFYPLSDISNFLPLLSTYHIPTSISFSLMCLACKRLKNLW